jgi:hypothetical protein
MNSSFISNNNNNNNRFTLRLCHLRRLNSSVQYGFNIKSKTNLECQYIGKVDKLTPADLAGVKSGDKIIEINNINASSLNYADIMKIIKSGFNNNPNELLLLVVDETTDNFYKSMSNDSLSISTHSTNSASVPYFYNDDCNCNNYNYNYNNNKTNIGHYRRDLVNDDVEEIEITIPSNPANIVIGKVNNNHKSNYKNDEITFI